MDARALLARKKLERKKAAAAKPKINSLFAEYDSLGKLKCKICLVNIKHESLWNSHVASRQHKLAIQRIKDEKNKLKTSTITPSSSSSKPIQKKVPAPKQDAVLLSGYGSDSDSNSDDDSNNNNETVEDEPNRKRIKVSDDNNSNLPPGFFDKTGSDSGNENNEDDDVPSGLPAGFFDKDTKMKEKEKENNNNNEKEEESTQDLSSLPKGFFDNNNKDETAMDITEEEEEGKPSDLPSNFFDQKLKPKQMLDKEKLAEDEKLKNEMELFEKEIQQEALNVDIIEEQEEDDFYDRRDKEIELEQEQYMSRMALLKNKKQQMQENRVKNQMAVSKTNGTKKGKEEDVKMNEDTSSDSDSDLEDELYNWRSRGL